MKFKIFISFLFFEVDLAFIDVVVRLLLLLLLLLILLWCFCCIKSWDDCC